MVIAEAARRDRFPDLILTLLIGTPIAAVFPFDVLFSAATGGSMALRAGLFVALALSGTMIGNRVGLSVHFHGARHPALVGVGAAFLVAVAIALLDGVIWRRHLPPVYLQYLQSVGLAARLVGYMSRAFYENVLYRLFLFSVLVFVLGRLWTGPDRRPATGAIWVAMIIAQTVNVAANVAALRPDGLVPAQIAYDVIRYVAPGLIWAQLYRYFGFATLEIASTGCHVFLQPMFSVLLDAPV